MGSAKRQAKRRVRAQAHPQGDKPGASQPLEPVYVEDIASFLVYGEGWIEVQPDSLTIRAGRVTSERDKPSKLEWIAYFSTPEGKRVEIPLKRISLARLR